MSTRYLFCFDFDWTLLDTNSDTHIFKDLEPSLYAKLRHKGKETSWNTAMASLLLELSSQFTRDEIVASLARAPFPLPSRRLLSTLSARPDCEVHIMSDSNVFFIREILKAHGIPLDRIEIHTNVCPYVVLDDQPDRGRLELGVWGSHNCSRCNANICKGAIVDSILARRDAGTSGVEAYDRIFMIGDGRNDFCPSLRLREGDLVLARAGFRLETLLEESREKRERHAESATDETMDCDDAAEIVVADSLVWADYDDLELKIQRALNE